MLLARRSARRHHVNAPRSTGGRGSLRERGQAIVEFTLILPVFLLLTLGIVDATRMFNAYIALTNGVREAALYASAGTNYTKWCLDPADAAGKLTPPAISVACPLLPGGTPIDPLNYSRDPDNIAYHLAGEATGIDPSQITYSVPACDNGNCDTTSLRVTITASYPFAGLTPLVWSNGITLTASTTMKIIR